MTIDLLELFGHVLVRRSTIILSTTIVPDVISQAFETAIAPTLRDSYFDLYLDVYYGYNHVSGAGKVVEESIGEQSHEALGDIIAKIEL